MKSHLGGSHVSKAPTQCKLALLTGRFYFSLSLLNEYFWHLYHFRAYKWVGAASWRERVIHRLVSPLFSSCVDLSRRVSANSRIDEERSVRVRLTALQRRHVANPSIVIERSDRLTTPRLARLAFLTSHLALPLIRLTYLISLDLVNETFA